MKEEQGPLNQSQKKTLLKFFGISAGITLLVAFIIVVIGVWSYNTYIYDGSSKKTEESGDLEQMTDKEKEKHELATINRTIAVFGVDDDEVRTDVIIVVNFNSKTNKIKVVSVPRDTKVVWSEEQRAALKEDKGYTQYVSKINEMTAYGGMKNIRKYTMNELENILGITIDNYAVVNLEAFRKIVDTIGGVEVDVPSRMQYSDPYQNLYIDLQPGVQLLRGDKAEQLVRFRSYPRGDEDRIVVQQLFLQSFAEKIMSPQTLTKLPQFINILIKDLTTDVSLPQIMDYYPYLQNFNIDNLAFATLPGEGRMENGVSYFFIDTVKLPEFIENIFYDREVGKTNDMAEDSQLQTSAPSEGTNLESQEPIIDKSVSIELLNAAGVQGLAGRIKDSLEGQGYQVKRIGNYKDGEKPTTIIYAKDATKGEQFKTYFKGAIVVASQSITTDIQIVLGQDYKVNE
ncbi:hypothetical protein CS063_06265 [Sporanaerobium hydrogeniformans]|uniref:Uncharacterized protein n=1 Tax=Sporanaerobium hydrogeniformans TaxID=3072179 RepID=A0AC61DEE4_9FIRM|nr:LCP family protein [Sporanaerobium hydrogeniformans]PHV71292.1 hypothetical protein CS063_06265 [Sporanaerobium hydrogeniformans]